MDLGFQELVTRVETILEGVSGPQRQRRRVYSPRHRLRRGMVGDNPILQLFAVVQVRGRTSFSSVQFVIGMYRWNHVGRQSLRVISLGSGIGNWT